MKPLPLACIATVLIGTLVLPGCGEGQARGPYNSDGSAMRDITKAEATYQQAIGIIASDKEQAEKLLRAALGCDLYHGGAHNNLGVLLLNQGKLYDAAEEFEWARKLLPGSPEPRTNLALVLERGGKHQEAIDAARTALEVSPGDLPAMQTLALIQVREGLGDQTTIGYLDAIVMRCPDPVWSDWAQRQRLTLETRLRQP